MQRQLTLWPPKGRAAMQRIWRHLDEPQRTRLTAALASLIGKAVRPKDAQANAEDDHER
jgi:hypothetical protein